MNAFYLAGTHAFKGKRLGFYRLEFLIEWERQACKKLMKQDNQYNEGKDPQQRVRHIDTITSSDNTKKNTAAMELY